MWFGICCVKIVSDFLARKKELPVVSRLRSREIQDLGAFRGQERVL